MEQLKKKKNTTKAAVLEVNEKEDKLEAVSESHSEKDDNKNTVFNIPISNKFDILAKPISNTNSLPSLPVSPREVQHHHSNCHPELNHFQARISFKED